MTNLQKSHLEEEFERKKSALAVEMCELAEQLTRESVRVEHTKILDSYIGIGEIQAARINNLISQVSTIQDIYHKLYILEAREPKDVIA